jgi:molybdopterin-guanine dinucleotide biosynthesis protein A
MPLLPVHGFVLAGGKSTRMGGDKAMMPFCGRPMVEIAVEKLRSFCAEVSIAGNRNDLARYADVVQEARLEAGPAAGVEAGLKAARQEWVLFIPVDVPLVPVELLLRWVEEALRVKMSVSYLGIVQKQPAFCLLQRERLASFSRLLNEGERRLEVLLNQTASTDEYALWMYDAYELYGGFSGDGTYHGPDDKTLERWFANVNTPDELVEAEESFRLKSSDDLGGSAS